MLISWISPSEINNLMIFDLYIYICFLNGEKTGCGAVFCGAI